MTHGRRGEFSEKALTTKGGAFCFGFTAKKVEARFASTC